MYDVIVIGGGPAGMMAAISASDKYEKILLLEKNDKLGKKLILTGNGRCNLTNNKSELNFLKEINCNKDFLKPSIYNFGPEKIIAFFSKYLKLKEENDNKIFPESNKSVDILNVLIKELNNRKIEIKTNQEVLSILENKVKTKNEIYNTKKTIIATGGASYPSTGSTINNYKIIPDKTTPLYPAETFLILKEKLNLSGITLKNVILNYNNIKITDDILFTHKGLSGPAIFKISEEVYKSIKKENVLKINLLPNINIKQEIIKYRKTKNEIITALRKFLPEKLALYVLNKIEVDPHLKIASISKKQINLINENIHCLKLVVEKTGSLSEAFVTGGGVDIKYINKKNLNSKKNKDIYYAGEVLDLHGPIGGYNITIALSTGYTAGKSV